MEQPIPGPPAGSVLPRGWRLLERSLPTAAENLALDEALWRRVAAADWPDAVLRIWESPQVAVVLGRSSRAEDEVHLAACCRRGVPVLRRPTGGAAVVLGPGCRVFSLFWRWHAPCLAPPAAMHRRVLLPLAEELSRVGPPVALAGTSDLVCRERKISGTSLRLSRTACWYHGTLLYNMELRWLDQLLKHPPREPEYRRRRPHREFVACYPLPADELDRVCRRAWGQVAPLRQWPLAETVRLVLQRYGSLQWNLSR